MTLEPETHSTSLGHPMSRHLTDEHFGSFAVETPVRAERTRTAATAARRRFMD
jgi:hypothetical protein